MGQNKCGFKAVWNLRIYFLIDKWHDSFIKGHKTANFT